MFYVTVINAGNKFWLRSTTWAFHADRGDRFAIESDAQKAIDKAKKFWAPVIRKRAVIEPVSV